MIMLTGGAGYIGSHVCVALLNVGLDVVVVDNLSNSKKIALERVQSICARSLEFRHADVRDEDAIYDILRTCDVSAVIHLAGLKAVGQSNVRPMTYYENNVFGTMRLVSAMKRAKIKTLVFSSSATVYGIPTYLPIDEKHPLGPTNPYGRTKFFIEEILKDVYQSDGHWRIGILRYFNPVGAHESGLIGEDPLGVPNNLVPFVAQVAIGRRDKLRIWGNDYDTPDGTGMRDFIHVADLASGHLGVLRHLKRAGVLTVNLGTGIGKSVLDVVRTFEEASGRSIPYEIGERRAGDVAVCYADPTFAKDALGWTSTRSLQQMCADHWRWQLQNPNGYQGSEFPKSSGAVRASPSSCLSVPAIETGNEGSDRMRGDRGSPAARACRPREVARNDPKSPPLRISLQVRCSRAWGFAMPHYRAYVLDEHGKLGSVVNLHCPDDASATKRAGRLADGNEVQLWRLVAELKFDDPRHRAKRRRSVRAPMH